MSLSLLFNFLTPARSTKIFFPTSTNYLPIDPYINLLIPPNFFHAPSQIL